MNQKLNHGPDTEIFSPIDDLAELLNRDHGEELSEFKDYLNDGLGILITIDDEESGIPLHLFAQGEDSAILTKRAEKLDKEKRRSIRALMAWVEGFENMANKVFKDYKIYLSQRINSVKKNAQTDIQALDRTISKLKKMPLGSTKAGKETIKTAEKKKSRLREFVNRLSEHSESVEKANDTTQLLDIETEMEKDVVAYDKKISIRRIKKELGTFFAGLGASAPIIEEVLPEPIEEPFDVFENLGIDPYVSSVDDEEGEGSSEAREELAL